MNAAEEEFNASTDHSIDALRTVPLFHCNVFAVHLFLSEGFVRLGSLFQRLSDTFISYVDRSRTTARTFPAG